MKRQLPSIALLAITLASTACAGGGRPREQRFNVAQPSEVIAAELAFARLAQERGQWTAFRETAAADAEMFVPQRASAQQWLRGRADPPVSVRWNPQAVWSSCDGSYAVTSGPWTGPNSSGTFVTVWQRQRDRRYKWVLDMSLTVEPGTATPEMIAAKVADCQPVSIARAVGAELTTGPAPDIRMNDSTDRTLSWISKVRAGGARQILVETWNGTDYDKVLELGERETE